jgi:hypothetical protein
MFISPKYKFFPQRLRVYPFNQIQDQHPMDSLFEPQLKEAVLKEGLLCPMVLNHKKHLVSGSHRYKILKELNYRSSEFYLAQNRDEEKFFTHLNVTVWQLHLQHKTPKDFKFLFEGTMKPLAVKCQHLFTVPINR